MPDPSPTLGLYCHIPFCASTCDFCAFYQEKPRRGDLDRYLEAMEREFTLLPRDRQVETVFWGGGTPGLLAAGDLDRLGRAMLEHLNGAPKEWTIEMAPSTVKADKLAVLKDMGVTRISMGVQSFDADLLNSLGRLHHPKQIYKAWELIQGAGFPLTNLDLIFAIPGQSIEQWEADIREAVSLEPNHISTYCLTFEEDTALYVKLAKGQIRTDEARELQFYKKAWRLFESLGYGQYEISNFAKPGRECLHNLNTWRMQEWIGCGPSAASQINGERYQRPANLDHWIEGMRSQTPPKEEVVPLGDRLLFTDSVVFGLRMNEGIHLRDLSERYPRAGGLAPLESLFERLAQEGLLKKTGKACRLTERGKLLADAIGSEVIERMDAPLVVSTT